MITERLIQDARYGYRQLVRHPGLTAVVTLVLAVGIGMTTAVFSVIRGVILQPMPYPDAGRIVVVEEQGRDGYSGPVSGPDFLDWRARVRWARALGALQSDWANLTGAQEASRVRAARVTAGMLDVMGVPPLLGRAFGPGDEEPGHQGVVVLAHEQWVEGFGADPEILGKSMTVNGEAHVIVGVMPPGFNMPSPWSGYRLWLPLSADTLRPARDWRRFQVYGRLSSNVMLEEAVTEMQLVAEHLAREYPDANTGVTATVTELAEVFLGEARRHLLLLHLATGFVLLIACANVAGILLAKATARGPEIAIRLAVGAQRSRLIKQFLTESMILSALGGLLAVIITLSCIKLFRVLLPGILPRTDQIRVDWLVLCFVVVVSALSGLLLGAAHAVATSRACSSSELLKAGRGLSAGTGHIRARSALLVAQFALTMVLAASAGLMLKSYLRVRNRPLGFAPEQTLVLDITLQGPAYEHAHQRWRYFEEALQQLRSVPGVEAAGATSKLPLWGGSNTRLLVEGRDNPRSPAAGPLVELSRVFPETFRALGIPILGGRELMLDDTAAIRPGAVISEELARQLFPHADPIGRRLSWEHDPPQWITVVGIAGDVRQWGLESEPQPEIYVPYTLLPRPRMFVVVRSAVEPSALGPAARHALSQVDRTQPVSGLFRMSDVVAGALAQRRFNTLLVTALAVVAVVLVASGIFGVMAYYVAQSRRELGIRIALGATPQRTLRRVIGRGLQLAGLGTVIGLVTIYAAGRILSSLLYDVSALDPAVLAGGTVGVIALGALGALVPALRVLAIDPAQALRGE